MAIFQTTECAGVGEVSDTIRIEGYACFISCLQNAAPFSVLQEHQNCILRCSTCMGSYCNSTRYAALPFSERHWFFKYRFCAQRLLFSPGCWKNNMIYYAFICDRSSLLLDIIGLRSGATYMLCWSDADTENLSLTVEIPRIVCLVSHPDILRNEVGHSDWCDVSVCVRSLFAVSFVVFACLHSTSIWRNLWIVLDLYVSPVYHR
jgi:hypothetical protein